MGAVYEADRSHDLWNLAGDAEINDDLLSDQVALPGKPVTPAMDPILRIHNPDLLDFLSTAWKEYTAALPDAQAVIAEMFIHPGLVEAMPVGRAPATNAYGRLGWFCFDTSSPLAEGSWHAALASVDIALSGVDRLLAGEKVVYSLCRPPGHHATRSAFGGFCLMNNAAIAAQALIDDGATRVTVLDVDAHHGNGTQQIFYQRGDVQFVSIHMPYRIFINVDLPAPFSPQIAWISPSSTARST